MRAGTALGGFLFVAGVASLVWQFRNGGVPLPFPGLQGLDPGVALYGAAGAAGLGLAMAVVGWRSAVKERRNEDFWNSATRVDPDMAGYREEDDARLDAQAGPGWRWLFPFMIAGFITGAVLYLEQTWYYTNSPYRYMAIALAAVVLVAWGILWAIWRGIRAVISRRLKKGRRWDVAVRGGGRSMRAVRKGRSAATGEQEPAAAAAAGSVLAKPQPQTEAAEAGADSLDSGEGGDTVADPGSDLDWDDLGAPEPRRLAEAIRAVLEHERLHEREAAVAAADPPKDSGSKPKTRGRQARRR